MLKHEERIEKLFFNLTCRISEISIQNQTKNKNDGGENKSMNIIEAINIAKVEQKAIRREGWAEVGLGIIPTNSDNLGVLVLANNGKKGTRYWNPSAEDLVAEDWEVF